MSSNEVLSDYTKHLILTIRGLSQQDDLFLQATPKTVQKLIITLEEILVDKKMRKPVLKAITGLPIASQNQLTQHTQSVLIDNLKEHQNDDAIREIEQYLCERYAENLPDFKEESIYADGLLASVSDLPDGDIPF